jgi:hypothetical protein
MIKWRLLSIVGFLSIVACAQPAHSQVDIRADSEKKLFLRGLLEGKVPRASARTILWGDNIFSKCPNSCASMSDLAMTLSKALRESGYLQQGWYLTNSSTTDDSTKIVAVTQLEQILDNGKPKTGRDRWKDQASNPPVSSLSDFMTTLLRGASPGRYRAFLFGFSDVALTNELRPWRVEEKITGLRNAIRSGARMPLFASLKNISTSGSQCYVFIYEYTVSRVDGSIRLVENSELTAEQHLKASGIWKALGGK